jgi:hypothetical protein
MKDLQISTRLQEKQRLLKAKIIQGDSRQGTTTPLNLLRCRVASVLAPLSELI